MPYATGDPYIANKKSPKAPKPDTSKAASKKLLPEFLTFANFKDYPVRPYLSYSPKNRLKIIDIVVEKLDDIETHNIRKHIKITKQDLATKLNDLRSMTRLNIDEHLKVKLKRWSQKKFIKVDEREIRQIIKRDTKTVKNFL
jgi:hypothetical protein